MKSATARLALLEVVVCVSAMDNVCLSFVSTTFMSFTEMFLVLTWPCLIDVLVSVMLN